MNPLVVREDVLSGRCAFPVDWNDENNELALLGWCYIPIMGSDHTKCKVHAFLAPSKVALDPPQHSIRKFDIGFTSLSEGIRITEKSLEQQKGQFVIRPRITFSKGPTFLVLNWDLDVLEIPMDHHFSISVIYEVTSPYQMSQDNYDAVIYHYFGAGLTSLSRVLHRQWLDFTTVPRST